MAAIREITGCWVLDVCCWMFIGFLETRNDAVLAETERMDGLAASGRSGGLRDGSERERDAGPELGKSGSRNCARSSAGRSR